MNTFLALSSFSLHMIKKYNIQMKEQAKRAKINPKEDPKVIIPKLEDLQQGKQCNC